MEFYSKSTNSNDYETFLLHHTWLSEVCKDGCQMEEDVASAKYIIELVLIPVVGSIGILGNSVSIFVLCKSSQKTTFQHVSDEIYVVQSVIFCNNIFRVSSLLLSSMFSFY